MGRNKVKNGRRVELISGAIYASLLAASNSGSIPLQPSNSAWGTRLNSIADTFGLYRFTMLRLKSCQSGGTLLFGVVAGNPDTPPATATEVSQVEYSQIDFATQTIPATLSVPRGYLLKSPISWYQSVPGTAATGFEQQGLIVAGASAAITASIFIEYEIEFTDWLATTNTPLYRELRNKCEPSPSSTGDSPGMVDRSTESTHYCDTAERKPAGISAQLASVSGGCPCSHCVKT